MLADEATRDAWLEWRRGGIGASEIGAVCRTNPWDSPLDVYLRKIGRAPDAVQTDAMLIGHLLEEPTAEMFRRRTGLFIVGEQTQCEHPDFPWARCTVDGFVVDSPHGGRGDALGVFEGKTTQYLDGFEPLPAYVADQVQWQLFVTGEEFGWVGVLATGQGFRVVEVPRDDHRIGELAEQGAEFWTCVQTLTPPPAYYSEGDAEALAAAYPEPEPLSVVELGDDGAQLVEELRAARDSLTVMEHRAKAAENALKALLGDHEAGLVDGRAAVTWKATPRRAVDVKALRAGDPDLAERYTTTTTVRRFLLK